jgi:hypothetical protein
MKAKVRLAIAAAVAIFGLGVAFLAKPASAAPCSKQECYAVTVDYDGMGPAICCHYMCSSGDTWACVPGT